VHETPRAIVYVDGFNLYYGCLRRTPNRWLDVGAFARAMMPGHRIVAVRYFTAIVDDPSGSVRQQVYLEALRTLPNVTVHLGHFLTQVKKRPLRIPLPDGTTHVDVLLTEEKGSDVNIAAYLLLDGFRDRYDVAAVVSNDSDLKTPMLLARQNLKKTVGVINPHQHPARTLLKTADFYKKVRAGVLAHCQLPVEIRAKGRAIKKPAEW
jgi:hypothetical protein